jgi:hypothetical protein
MYAIFPAPARGVPAVASGRAERLEWRELLSRSRHANSPAVSMGNDARRAFSRRAVRTGDCRRTADVQPRRAADSRRQMLRLPRPGRETSRSRFAVGSAGLRGRIGHRPRPTGDERIDPPDHVVRRRRTDAAAAHEEGALRGGDRHAESLDRRRGRVSAALGVRAAGAAADHGECASDRRAVVAGARRGTNHTGAAR